VSGAGRWITVACCVAACVPGGLRWLRVAQREHYLAGSTTRFALRWWRTPPVNPVVALVAVLALAASGRWPLAGVVTAAAVAAGPLGLAVRGRTSPLSWTRRLRTLATTTAVVEAVVVVVGVLSGPVALLAAAAALAVPLAVDLSCLLLIPVEDRLSARYVDRATTRLAVVDPTVVAITGSYGKTSTKGHLAHLVRDERTVVASPASFNNRAGLARAVNEHLADGTEVFIAEMGTYGAGEIAALCRWCPPDIAVITAIGPVHLERFGTEDRIVEAKSEILEGAPAVILPVDDPRLAVLADRAADAGKRVTRCSAADAGADVFVRRAADQTLSAFAHGVVLAEGVSAPPGVQPTNLACAIGVALALGVDPAAVGARLCDLPPVGHRLDVARSATGVCVLDDTYNANPAGAAAALAALAAAAAVPGAEVGPTVRAVVVTPGMVELGPRQFEENRRFGEAAAAVATDLVIVGRTNRKALERGAQGASGPPVRVTRAGDRPGAVAWVRANLVRGDAVLYENDLPDHYP
jgi:UDP-N-acetylmuramoyl-tripeptide--D-alanyl-D-alanine ligase